jgi:hypothetical protein
VAALLADPIGAPNHLAARARAELAQLEPLARLAIALDAGPAIVRPVLGVRPATEAVPEILGDGAAGISRAVAAVTPQRQALVAAQRPAPAPPTGVIEAVAASIVDAIRGPDRTIPREAPAAVARLDEVARAVARAHRRLVGLVLGVGACRWLEALIVALAIQAGLHRLAPRHRPPGPRPLDGPQGRALETRRWRRRCAAPDPIEKALVRIGVPGALAGQIAAQFAEAPDWPGSLRGHDPEPGGLGRHTRRVIERMTEETASWPDDGRVAGAVVGAAHDLGKLVAYRRVGPDRWVGCAATPHDTLSAILLAQCPAWPAFASAAARAAILQCLHAEHAPEGLPVNAPPLARELLVALARADAEAARATASTPEADRETPDDAA